MTRVAIVNAGTLTLYDQNGHGAVELARLRVNTADPAAILAIVEGMTPFLAASGVAAKPKRSTGMRYDWPPLVAQALDYVREHPGATTSEVKAAIGHDAATGTDFLNRLRAAGLKGVKAPDSPRAEPWRWYHPDQVKTERGRK